MDAKPGSQEGTGSRAERKGVALRRKSTPESGWKKKKRLNKRIGQLKENGKSKEFSIIRQRVRKTAEGDSVVLAH